MKGFCRLVSIIVLWTCIWSFAEGHEVERSRWREGVAQPLAPSAIEVEMLTRLSTMEAELAEVKKEKGTLSLTKLAHVEKPADKDERRSSVHGQGSRKGNQQASQVAPKQKGEKYPFIHWLHKKLEIVFGRYTDVWWHDWKLWVGSVFWIGTWAWWLYNGFEEAFLIRVLFTFGINIIVLHILQYAETVRLGLSLISGILFCQAMFNSYLMWEREGGLREDFECDTVYMDMSLPGAQILVLFIGQISVWWFYFTSILANFHIERVNYLFWMAAYVVMQLTMIFNRGEDSVLGKAFPVHEWYQMACKANLLTFQLEGGNHHPFRLSRANIIIRGVTGYFCNTLLREIMAYTIPLMLMGFSEPMDFVVYCVGVNFICTLDDMRGKNFEIKEHDSEEEAEQTEQRPFGFGLHMKSGVPTDFGKPTRGLKQTSDKDDAPTLP